MTLWEIELSGTAADGGWYYHTVVVHCDDQTPAGRAPAAVCRHGRMLRDIAGGSVGFTVAAYAPVWVSEDYPHTRSATAIGPLALPERTIQ
jgi:hypothetical protein